VTLPYLASLANGQLSVLNRHVLEHEAQHNIADKAMLKDDLENVRRTLDKFEQELEKAGEKDENRGI
jgi:uncharacterized membrane protein YcaP (DUF421 family)